MTTIDAATLRQHIGTRMAEDDIATEAPLKAIVAAFDREEEAPRPGRMYAGTRITFQAPLRVGDAIHRETELTDLQVREGGTGVLIVTTQTRRISTSRGLAITEEYDTVFREEVKAGA